MDWLISSDPRIARPRLSGEKDISMKNLSLKILLRIRFLPMMKILRNPLKHLLRSLLGYPLFPSFRRIRSERNSSSAKR